MFFGTRYSVLGTGYRVTVHSGEQKKSLTVNYLLTSRLLDYRLPTIQDFGKYSAGFTAFPSLMIS